MVQHRRFAHALRDFEYALQTEKVAHEMLRAEFVDEGGPVARLCELGWLYCRGCRAWTKLLGGTGRAACRI